MYEARQGKMGTQGSRQLGQSEAEEATPQKPWGTQDSLPKAHRCHLARPGSDAMPAECWEKRPKIFFFYWLWLIAQQKGGKGFLIPGTLKHNPLPNLGKAIQTPSLAISTGPLLYLSIYLHNLEQ